jgi:drug/metabolite transporter (DMT)-like permease
MIAVLGGLGAALAWTASTVCSSRSSRLLDPASVLAWVMLAGLVVAIGPALGARAPAHVSGGSLLWLAFSGAGNVAGLLVAYMALRAGQVAIVAPLLSTEGAMAALIAVLAGESISVAVGATLVLIVLGIALAATPADGLDLHETRHHGRAVLLAVTAALLWGGSLYAAGRAGTRLPAAWVGAAARVVGVPVLTIPLALSGRLRLTRAAVPFLLVTGVCEVLGFYAYTAGARHGIAVAAVLSSQFGSFSALAGFVLFRERLSRAQSCGVAAALVGVAVLAGLQS